MQHMHIMEAKRREEERFSLRHGGATDIGQRERPQELPLFDIAGLAATPEDLDPMEPAASPKPWSHRGAIHGMYGTCITGGSETRRVLGGSGLGLVCLPAIS